MFSVVGSIVSSTLERIKAPSTPRPSAVQTPLPKPEVVRYSRYYKDGAAVSTQFGNGVIRSFREKDGFYVVELLHWCLRGNVHPIVVTRKDALSHRIAKGCNEGYPVLTTLGVSGVLASVEPTTGTHLVTVPSAGMVCYLQPDSVIMPLKAAIGEAVLTAYGEGVVKKYSLSQNTYEIKLCGWGGTLYAKAERFDRVDDSQQDRLEPFGMNWLLRFLFSVNNKQKSENGQRSRSNSVASLRSVRSTRSTSGTLVRADK